MSQYTDILSIKKAERTGSRVLIALYGFSGSGKTHSALLLARGLTGPTGKIGMLDTESNRGLYFSEKIPGGYDHAELTPPFTAERYAAGIKQFEKAGYDVLVIDSASHEWNDNGGVLHEAGMDNDRKGGKNRWAGPKVRHTVHFVSACRHSRMHIIFCLQAKEITDENFRNPQIVPIQERLFIHDMTVQLYMPSKLKDAGQYVLDKCLDDLLPAFPVSAEPAKAGERIGIKNGEMIRQWVMSGKPIDKGVDGLKKEGDEAAARGRDTFVKFWNRPDVKQQWGALREYLPNFQSIVDEAERVAAEETPEGDPFPPSSMTDPADPFGSMIANTETNATFPGDLPSTAGSGSAVEGAAA